MNTLRILYHLARADFLERIRRYRFLMMLGLVLWIGYLSASGQFRMRVPPDYLGVINSAWVGATMTITVSLLLGWVGFYLVKGAVSRDYETGVGQIMATTPLSRPLYTLGKWASNFAVLGLMVLLLLLMGVVMQLAVGVEDLNVWKLSQPILLIAFPVMAVVAAVAVLFETIPWLRGGLGNILYFIAFLVVLITSAEGMDPGASTQTYHPWGDFAGWQLIGHSVSQAAKTAYPESEGGFAFSITELQAPKYFHWNGIDWTGDILLSRLFYLLLAVGVALLAAVFFDRFNLTRISPASKKKGRGDVPDLAALSSAYANGPAAAVPGVSAGGRLTPLAPPGAGRRARFRFDALFIAELKLLLKGQRWWWYGIAAGLIIAQLAADLDGARNLLLAAWLWPILILSGLGCRENRYNTHQIVFAAPRPIANQLPAAWLAAFVILAGLGSGALIKFILLGEIFSVLGWFTGAIFIPSLALGLGTVTGSSRAFEAIYILWMYILTQKARSFDFVGFTPNSPLSVYVLLSVGIIAITLIVRQYQTKNR